MEIKLCTLVRTASLPLSQSALDSQIGQQIRSYAEDGTSRDLVLRRIVMSDDGSEADYYYEPIGIHASV